MQWFRTLELLIVVIATISLVVVVVMVVVGGGGSDGGGGWCLDQFSHPRDTEMLRYSELRGLGNLGTRELGKTLHLAPVPRSHEFSVSRCLGVSVSRCLGGTWEAKNTLVMMMRA